VVTLVAQLALSFTTHGRRMYAIGGNPEAARLSGRHRVHQIAAAGINLRGSDTRGQQNAAQPGQQRSNHIPVAAAWIGFSLAGSGKPNALGTLVGAVILGVLSNGSDTRGQQNAAQPGQQRSNHIRRHFITRDPQAGELGQVPTIVIIMLVVTLVAQLALSFTTHGRRMYAIK
jgi:ribose/xylose/arabinose/galactoside ABC-type transport system permease subunit